MDYTTFTHEYAKQPTVVTAPYKCPRAIEYVGELPKTISGKIKRGELRKNEAFIVKR